MRTVTGFAVTPWLAPALNPMLAEDEILWLRDTAADLDGFGPGVAAPIPGRQFPSISMLRRLHDLGVIELTETTSGPWEPAGWLARLTALGANVAFRSEARVVDAQLLDAHLGCGGHWLPDGACTRCPARRPLDEQAYIRMLSSLPAGLAEKERCSPRLWCIEHGRLRHDQFSAVKLCRMNGTHLHDGGTHRI